jgi:hypothetical protein
MLLAFAVPATLILGSTYMRLTATATPESSPGVPLSQPATNRVISLIPVVADPRKYHGQEIAVQGFFSHDKGQWVLASELTSLRHNVAVNCLNLDVSHCDRSEELLKTGSRGMCVLVGTVDADDLGRWEYLTFACTFRAKQCRLAVKLSPE